jgi:hypothetical protein
MTMSVLSKITVGAVGLAALGVAGYAVAFIPSPLSSDVAPLTTVIAPAAVTRSIVCAGNVVGYVGDSAEISAAGSATQMSTPGSDSRGLAMADSMNGSAVTLTGDSLLVAATEYDAVQTESVAGFLATECGDALNEQWLVGGSTMTGRDTILTISNGSDVEARVDIDIWGSQGMIDAPGSRGIVVAPMSQRSYSVAGFAPDEPSPALRLTSSGAAVWATLQTTAVRGLVPGGLDRIGPVSAPTTSLTFPIVRIPGEDSIGAALIDPGYADIMAAIRFLAPGESDAAVSITLDPVGDGDSLTIATTIGAGSTLDIPLSDLDAGDWSVTIDSDQPLVAAVRVGFHDPRNGITDIAWASAAPAQTGIAALFVPAGAVLGLSNPTTNDVTVTILSGGETVEVVIPARGARVLPVTAGLVTVTSTGNVSTAAFVSAPEGIATLRGLTAPIDAANIVIVSG